MPWSRKFNHSLALCLTHKLTPGLALNSALKKLRRLSGEGRRNQNILKLVREFAANQTGVAALEYVLIISVVVILVAALVGGFGQNIINLFSSVTEAI
jgi:Flp pilus assembly pilin Flp